MQSLYRKNFISDSETKLDLTEFSHKSQNPKVYHIGNMAPRR